MTRFSLICLVMTLLVACGAPQSAAPSPAPPTSAPSATLAPSPTPAPPTPPAVAALQAGLRVDIGGRSLFLQCLGTASGPTVLLEAGLGGDHTSWAQVQPAAAGFARVCSYDRAGLGQSDPAPTPRSAEEVVADLAALLNAAGLSGPYILVAHSFGALHARLFAARHPADVAGLVLVDPVHEEWWARSLAALPPETAADSERLKNFRAFLTSDVADPGRNQEGLDIPATVEQLRASGSLGARPLVVLSAERFDVVAPGLPPAVEARLRELFQRELPAALLELSSDSTQIGVPRSGHAVPRERPDVVVLGIKAVLAAVAQ